MRAAEIYYMRRAAFTAVQCKALAHDLNRFSLAGAELFSAMNRMPKSPHELPGEATRPGGDEILVA